MSGIEKIANEEIDKALADNDRQYLVGNLKFPQQLQHIPDDNVNDYKDMSGLMKN